MALLSVAEALDRVLPELDAMSGVEQNRYHDRDVAGQLREGVGALGTGAEVDEDALETRSRLEDLRHLARSERRHRAEVR